MECSTNLPQAAFFSAEEKVQLISGNCPRHITKERLKEWLSFRKGTAKDGSARSEATKAELSQRVISYIKNGWENNFTEKWQHLAASKPLEQTATVNCDFPGSAQWVSLVDAKDDVPSFNIQNIVSYFIERKAKDNESNKDFKNVSSKAFGECWSGVNAENSYKQDGPSQECLTNDFLKCGPKDKYCVGKQDTNFVYALNGKVYNLTVLLSNNSFDDHLRFAHSPQFIELRREFELGVLQAYDGYNPFLGVTTLRFSKAPGDSHTVVHFVIEFKDKGVHLHNLTAALARENLGKLTLLPSLGQVACYKGPFPPVCPLPCFSACAPRCYFSCCQQYHLNYYAILPPPHNIHRAPCPEGCPITCAPFGCTTHCCHSLPHYEYGKRHQAPKLGSNRKLATSSIDIIRRIKRKKKKPGAKRIKETNSSEKNF
ncbi:hypothetical protein pdam_00016633 [Pocillopora damicornis]|uniref:SEA domain-containing protein n=1 Tax=Pocillopora damicornis TaxID=46731 RepID=A0A3M6TFN3_POCDA|nr:hypothetical protein pdam_00016633 [Pocillopora damicornis]